TFENKVLSGLILAQEKNPIVIINESSNAKPGQAIDTFIYDVKAKGRAILLSEQDLKEISEIYFTKELTEDQKFLSESIKINPLVGAIDESLNTAKLSLDISGKIYKDLETRFVKDQLKGRPVQEVEKSFSELSQISKAKIKIIPSFIKNLPQDINKIELKLNFD
ncbi:MAG: hypothetical protein COX42_00530, partial [Parcubacteria group bacterium CG23_combo_of_CG06-09_8_20_14_all_35_6]